MGNGMNKILPGLYIGNFRDAKDPVQLAENKITHILSIHDNARPLLEDKKYLCVYASDTPDQNLTPHFRNCSKFIHKARMEGGSVLVHCLAGVSRSVTVTIAYIMTATGHSWRDVFVAVKQSRTVAQPNHGFQQQLQQFEDNGVEAERKWFKEKFGANPFNDAHLIQEQKTRFYDGKVCEQSQSPDPQPSGSTSASFPLNKEEDVLLPSVSKAKRMGICLNESDIK